MVMTVSALSVVLSPHLRSIILVYFLGLHPFPNPILLLIYLYFRLLIIRKFPRVRVHQRIHTVWYHWLPLLLSKFPSPT